MKNIFKSKLRKAFWKAFHTIIMKYVAVEKHSFVKQYFKI